MKIELLITSRGTGKIFDCSNCMTSAKIETVRTGSPGKLTFSVLKSGNLSFLEGDPVRFTVDGQLQFYGWVFTKSKDRWGAIEVTCYDRLRYLKANASYAFYAMTAGGIIKQIAGDFGITTGTIENTGYALPSLVEEDQCCLDIIGAAVQQTLLNTSKVFIFYDNGSGLCLQEAPKMRTNIVIGEKSYLTDYTYKTDIDQQTYNYIKLARPNENTGRTDVFIAEDSASIAEWGLLQLYQSIDENLNDAQAKAQAQTALAYYNRRLRTLSCSSLGILGLRAGMMIKLYIPKLGDINLEQWVLLEKVTHTFENEKHTMDFETMAI